MMSIDKRYLEEAKQMLSGGMESQKIQLQNSYAQNVGSLEGQKGGVNQNFARQLEQNSINTTNNTNQYLNNSLARGLGRSTIATSGAAGIKDSGARRSNYIETDKTNALDNIEAQKVQLEQALQSSLLGLNSSNESDAMKLAMQLEQNVYDRMMDQKRLASGRGGSGGKDGKDGPTERQAKASWAAFDQVLGKYVYEGGFSPVSWIEQQYKAGNIDMDTYQQMDRMASEKVANKAVRNTNNWQKQQQSQAQASERPFYSNTKYNRTR